MALGVLRFCAVKRQAYAGLIRVNRNDTDINLCKFDRWDGEWIVTSGSRAAVFADHGA